MRRCPSRRERTGALSGRRKAAGPIPPRIVLLGLVILGAVGAQLRAQVIAPSGRTLFNRTLMLRSFVRLDSFAESAPGGRTTRVVNPTALVWGATPRLNLSFVVPLVAVDRDGPGSETRGGDSSGSADGKVFARYRLLRRNVHAGTAELASEVGVRLPTGGAFGTGSTGYTGALIVSRIRDPHWFVADGQFDYNTEGDDDVRPGRQWRGDLAYLLRAWPRTGMGAPGLMLVFELNGQFKRRSRLRGERIENTGGNVVYFSPGAEIFLSRRLVLEASVPIRIASSLDGRQDDPTASVLVGVRWLR